MVPLPPLLLLLLLPPALPGPPEVTVTRPRGVALTNLPFYDPSRPFRCLDGSATVDFSWVNDDYCDCGDGSDEPGTPACPNGRFHCTNAGHRPRTIPAAHVNDGVCDCCDGTDEWDSGAGCENTCRERGRREREARQRLAALAREGFVLRQRLVQEAAEGRRDKQARLGGLQESRKELEQRVGTLRAAKEAAEGPERAARGEHRRKWGEQRAAAAAAQDEARAAEAFAELDTDGDGRLTGAELQAHPELDPDGDGTFSEAEAEALLGPGGAVDSGTFRERIWESVRERLRPRGQAEPPQTPPEPPLDETPPQEEEEEEEPEEEEDEEEEEEGPDEELKVPPPQPQEGKEPPEEEPPEEEPPYDEATQALIDAAQRARDELAEAERALKEAEDGIKALEQELGFDFGPEGEFSYLYNQCYELSTSEYVYRLCPFHRVTQRPKNGGSETNLGTWGSWAGPEGDKFSAHKYEQGMGCWQGPNRATTVRLMCGTDTALVAATEPSRCEYLLELETPAACREPPAPHDEHDEL